MAEQFLLQAIQYEQQKKFDLAITFYKKAYKLNPELEFRDQSVPLEIDGKKYDEYGELIEIIQNKISFIPECLDLPNVLADVLFPID